MLGRDLTGELVFCSRSGPPDPALARARRQRPHGASSRPPASALWSTAPIGFVSDHMEVVYDLDTEAQATADGSASRSSACRRSAPTRLRRDLVDAARSSARRRHGARSVPQVRGPDALGVRARVLPQPAQARPALCGND